MLLSLRSGDNHHQRHPGVLQRCSLCPFSLAAATDFHKLKAAQKCHSAVLSSRRGCHGAGTEAWAEPCSCRRPRGHPRPRPPQLPKAHTVQLTAPAQRAEPSRLVALTSSPIVRTWGSPEPQPRTVYDQLAGQQPQNSPWPCNQTQSQAPRMGTGTPVRGHYSARVSLQTERIRVCV